MQPVDCCAYRDTALLAPVSVEALVDSVVEGVAPGPARHGARPLELHVVEHEGGVDEGVRRGACARRRTPTLCGAGAVAGWVASERLPNINSVQ